MLPSSLYLKRLIQTKPNNRKNKEIIGITLIIRSFFTPINIQSSPKYIGTLIVVIIINKKSNHNEII